MILTLAVYIAGCLWGTSHSELSTVDQILQQQQRSMEELESLRNIVAQLSRQSILTQLHIEEQTRSQGSSGLKQVRHAREGTKTYHSDSVYGHSFSSIHDHANNIRTIGMGEVIAVLNGVEFRTRHNDYGLIMPSLTSTEYQATDPVPFPEVPPSVLNQSTVEDQTAEMREYFRAWRDQDTSIRDYKPYFRPILCYMEGMWTDSNNDLEEPFESDRHFLNAKTWFELEEKARYQALSGYKGTGENLAYLPRTVINVTDGYPVFAQWNYDILCHPVKEDIPIDRFKVVDDLSARLRNNMPLGVFEKTRLARFQLNSVDSPFDNDSQGKHRYLDSLMHKIPGKNNYGAYFEDKGLEQRLYMDPYEHDLPLNAGYYHRNLFVNRLRAMGQQFRFRGFADENIYMAMTDQDEIAGMNVTICHGKNCRVVSQKWTYAIPLEIIYLTPLSKWNPYNIPYRGNQQSQEYNKVTAGGRNGRSGNAFDGTNSKNFYQTPAEFYDCEGGREVDTDSADTTPKVAVAVLDSSGTERWVRASGHRVFFPDIEGVGVLRQRYPIAPVHGEGSIFWKEIEALKEIAMDPISQGYLMYKPINAAEFSSSSSLTITFETQPANAKHHRHKHEFTLSQGLFFALRDDQNVTVTTSINEGHSHTFLLHAFNGLIDRIKYITCDGRNFCWDGHDRLMIEIKVTES